MAVTLNNAQVAELLRALNPRDALKGVRAAAARTARRLQTRLKRGAAEALQANQKAVVGKRVFRVIPGATFKATLRIRGRDIYISRLAYARTGHRSRVQYTAGRFTEPVPPRSFVMQLSNGKLVPAQRRGKASTPTKRPSISATMPDVVGSLPQFDAEISRVGDELKKQLLRQIQRFTAGG